MEIYGQFAQIYNQFIEAPYLQWANYIEKIWAKFGTKPNLVLDLACGTGVLTNILSNRGYDMIGVDLSVEMLAVAQRTNPKILFLQQDMRKFELYGSVDAIVCTCDSLNYILDNKQLEQVFKQAEFYLNPKGMMIFDINTEYKYSKILADNNFSSVSKTGAYIWENSYDETKARNQYQVTFFIGEHDKLYSRYEEIHIQKAHKPEEIKNALSAAKLNLIGEFDELTFNPPHNHSERVFFVAQKL